MNQNRTNRKISQYFLEKRTKIVKKFGKKNHTRTSLNNSKLMITYLN